MNEAEKGFCIKCGVNITEEMGELGKKMRVCPKCSSENVVKLTYKISSSAKMPAALRQKK